MQRRCFLYWSLMDLESMSNVHSRRRKRELTIVQPLQQACEANAPSPRQQRKGCNYYFNRRRRRYVGGQCGQCFQCNTLESRGTITCVSSGY
eukprot:1339135-Amphidinium_carterae.1